MHLTHAHNHAHGPPPQEAQQPGPSMLFFCLLGVLIESFNSFLTLSLLPFDVLQLVEKEGLEGAAEVGYIVGVCYVIQILTEPLFLRCSSFYGRRIALLGASIANLSAFYILSKPVDLRMLVIGRLIGSLSGSYVPLSHFYLCDLTPPQLRVQVLMILGGTYAFGSMMGAFVASTFELTFVSACNAAFFLSTFNFIVIYFCMIESLSPSKMDCSSSLFSFYPSLPSPLSISIHLPIFLCRLFSGFYLSCFEIFAPLLLHYQFGFSPSFSILLLSLVTGLHSLFQASPILTFTSNFLSGKTALCVSLALMTLCFPFTLSSPPTAFSSFPLTIFSLIPFAMGISISQPILSSYLIKSTSPQDTYSLTFFFSAFSRASSAIMAGVWFSTSTAEETVFWLAIVSALSIPFAFLQPSLSSLA